MAGLMIEHMMHGRVREASRLASETMALVESIGMPTLTLELSLAAISTKLPVGEMAEVLRWSQTRRRAGRTRPGHGERRFRIAVGGGAGIARHCPDDLFRSGQLLYRVAPTSVLVETLLSAVLTATSLTPRPRSPGWRPPRATRGR
jgi:hypothetical protein